MTRAGEIEKAFSTGTVVTGRFAVLRIVPSACGFGHAVVSGKRLGKATVRNRLRRRWREVVRRGPPLRDGCFVVVVVRGRTAEASFQELTAEWERLVRGAGLTRP
jgi:ribonuclease P protein component